MDRALSLQLLAAALGEQRYGELPTPEALQDLLAEAEVQLFLRRPVLSDDLLDVAWFLHAVASVDGAHERYTVARQRQAFAVSAHIFDLALAEPDRDRVERLELAFGAAAGYRRGELDPNAAAILRRVRADIIGDRPVLDHLATLALEAGLIVLGLQASPHLRRWRRQLRDLAELAGADTLAGTVFGCAEAVVQGGEALLQYLTRGDPTVLERALGLLRAAASGEAGPGDHLGRWVAAHLLGFAAEAADGSLFAVMPPEVPPGARHAFTLTNPPVLTLWRPQRELLASEPHPLAPATRRLVLSVPTSSGKTLMAQLLTVAHLAQAPSSGVCYVAPTRSLCREVRRTMAARVRLLQKEVGAEAPDFPLDGPGLGEDLFDFLARVMQGTGDVDVMTPERLAHQLRHDPPGVLQRFGLFIFDEAQLVQEQGRGFTLEAAISLLNLLTRDSAHRIVLLSAALGNAGQVMRWMDPQTEGLLHESDWRGPRRLHAMFSTDVLDWTPLSVERAKSTKAPYRQVFALHGIVALRPVSGRIRRLQTTEPVGRLVLKASAPNQSTGRTKDADRSTRVYEMASSMITMLGHAGSVLVVANTRRSAERMARQLATLRPELPEYVPLADFARQQLGAAHPLVQALSHGVGYHHAGLPTEVLEALEEALRDDALPFLTCTSTLTEGVNLPVRTVVLYDEQHVPDARLTPGRLVNAMGRAGRAGKESEGWIVLLRPGDSGTAGLDQLTPSAADLHVRSTLASEEALTELARLDEAIRQNEDAVFSAAASATVDFVSFVWSFLVTCEDIRVDPQSEPLEQLLDATLAGQQIPPPDRARWISAAEGVRRAYLRTDPTVRRRWARAGTSLASARQLDVIAARLLDTVSTLPTSTAEQLGQPHAALDLFAQANVLADLLTLPENNFPWEFRITTTAPPLPVPIDVAIRRWIDGVPLTDLADELLGDSGDAAWRISALVDRVSAHFEHFLAWTVGALLENVNGALTETGHPDTTICPELSGYIRYGVNSRTALALALAGVRSRRLLHAIAAAVRTDSGADEVRDWLSGLSLTEWRATLQASPSEILDLLDLTRARRGSLLRPLLEEGTTSLPVHVVARAHEPDNLTLRPIPGQPEPAQLGVYGTAWELGPDHQVATHDDTLIALVPPASHADVSALLQAGLELNVSLQASDETLVIALSTEQSES